MAACFKDAPEPNSIALHALLGVRLIVADQKDVHK
jgi:hypothetical protein